MHGIALQSPERLVFANRQLLAFNFFFLFFFQHETSLTTTITTACNVIVLSCLAGQLVNLILILTKTHIVVSACSEPLWARRVELTRAN